MKRLVVLILLTFALVGCTQTEGRYEIVRQSESSAWLVDRQAGCVWLFVALEKVEPNFLPIPVKGLHRGEFGKKVEGCSKEG
jgi:hypothetical protein